MHLPCPRVPRNKGWVRGGGVGQGKWGARQRARERATGGQGGEGGEGRTPAGGRAGGRAGERVSRQPRAPRRGMNRVMEGEGGGGGRGEGGGCSIAYTAPHPTHG
ncbi:hypothetical protein I4F81_002809 [Pyropia yezoensis]|uniref:Uncharacterized protein n=1 Tax=Pyropia yezoensis TaxID=2788 RepID=A0ACC3BQF7_PYRYE|nr:hypothetical protein I4F81_002809 [Neopyropia yezoensis]